MTYDQLPAGPEREAFDGVLARAVRAELIPCSVAALTTLEAALLTRHARIRYGVLRFSHADAFYADIRTLMGLPGGDPFGQLHCCTPNTAVTRGTLCSAKF